MLIFSEKMFFKYYRVKKNRGDFQKNIFFVGAILIPRIKFKILYLDSKIEYLD